ncbi:proline iminopeptidase-family hydrolase [Euzebya tangerina]|uniref:proline iminopeptidase-family hydrolase n=1 Tax=Euzebya tangerina TaxID=591198 RepID=UPI000E30E843|nr:proline iminopeptidase-family hydrolase [Euzebya tangerina]
MQGFTEHRIDVPGGSVYCETYGAQDGGTALVGLHGGPGAGAAYLRPLGTLSDLVPVVLYDQLGCGRSDIPDDDSLWQVDRFVRELDAVADALPYDDMILLGHSWGGWLALEYVLHRPDRVAGMILASTSASIASFIEGTKPLIQALPPEHREAIHTHDATGSYDHPDYLAAMEVFYQRHLCRADPWPDDFLESVGNLETSPVYPAMNGPNEFTVVGSLRTWDRTADLARIDAPTLVFCGQHDEIVPACTHELAAGIAGAEAVVIPDTSHTALNEAPDLVLPMLRTFVADVVAP